MLLLLLLFCLRFTGHGSAKGSTAMEYAQRYMRSLEALHSRENATLDGMSAAECSWGKEEDSEKTWLEMAEEEVITYQPQRLPYDFHPW